MTEHTLNVSREGVIGTLDYQFTRSTTFLSEILQNARRAKANTVWIEFNPESSTLIVRDNGTGITDFDALFTMGQSKWDPDVIAQEKAFGVGFISAVMASTHIAIRSLEHYTSFDTRAFLKFCPVQVERRNGPAQSGTELWLTLSEAVRRSVEGPSFARHPEKANEHWQAIATHLVMGFPLPVWFNNKPLPRPHALDSGLLFHSTEIGRLCLRNWEACTPTAMAWNPTLYCQGLPVTTAVNQYDHDILHLDSAVRLRMPDRDMLLEENQIMRQISAARERLWRCRLTEAHAHTAPERFVHLHWELCVQLGMPELLQDAPLAGSMLMRYTDLIAAGRNRHPLSPWEEPLPGPNQVLMRPLNNWDPDTVDNVPLANVYALVMRLPVLRTKVPPRHWSQQRAIDLADPELGLTYILTGETRSGRFQGNGVTCQVIACESFTAQFNPTDDCDVPTALTARLPAVTVTDRPFYDPQCNAIIVPGAAEEFGGVLLQVSDYHYGDTEFFHENDYECDVAWLYDFVEHLRHNSIEAYLEALLTRVSPDPDLLGERIFRIRYDQDRSRLIVVNEEGTPLKL